MNEGQDSHEMETSDQCANFEPFPEPNTYPSGWNMDSILNPMPPRKPDSEPMPNSYEKFKEPRTCPPGWELL